MNEELKIFITAEIADLKKELKNGQKQVEEFTKNGESGFKKFTEAAKKVGGAVKAGLKAATAAVVAAGAAIVGLSEGTAEYRAEQAKLQAAFKTAGASAEQATATYTGLYRVLGDSGQATEAANHLAKLTTNEKELSEWTNICQGIYATFGDSLPIEGLTEAANETAKVGQVTGGLADALNWAGVSEDAFNESLAACNNEAEREALIRETLNGLYSEAASNYEKAAGDILAANEAQAKLTEGLAAAGAAVQPVITLFKQGLADALNKLTPHLQTVAEALQGIFNGESGSAEKLSGGISSIFLEISNTVTAALPTLISVGLEVIQSLITGIIQAAPALLDAVSQCISQIALALPSLIQSIVSALPSLIENLTAALVSLTPNLVSGLVQCIVILCQSIDSILEPLIASIPQITIAVTDALMSNLHLLISGIITLVLAIVRNIPVLLDSLVSALPTVISLIVEGLLSCLPQLIAGLLQISLEVTRSLPSILKSILEGVVGILAGIWDGLEKVFGKLGRWFGDKFGGAVDAIKKAFASVGSFFSGVWGKIKSAFAAVGSWFKSIFSSAWSGIKNVFSGVGSFFSGIWNNIKSIFSKAGSAIADAVSGAFKSAINWVLSKAISIINGFIRTINGAIEFINLIPKVNIPKLSTLSVPQLEHGGVLKKGQIGLLEGKGAEAVVPLEKNTGWLDKIAERLNANTGGAPIVLQVDGKTFAQISVDSINQLTRLTGSLPLQLG